MTVIEAHDPGAWARLTQAWRYRRLTSYFGLRFLHKRYARTWLGRSWLGLRPALDLISGFVVFGGVLGISGGRAPYVLVFLIASAAWQLFAQTAYWATRSLEMSRRELRFLAIPRLIPIASSAVPGLVEYLIYLVVTVGVAIYYWIAHNTFYLSFDAATLLVLPGLALLLLLGVSIGLWTAPLTLRARDIRFGIGYLLSFWYFLTPVIYPVDAIPEQYRIIASFNPITAPVQMIKRGLLGYGEIPLTGVGISLGVLAVLALGGFRFLGRHERSVIDAI